MTPATPVAGGGINAALADLRNLIAATVAGGGSGGYVFITSPGRAFTIETYAPPLVGRVFGGAAVPDTTLVCLDPNGFCSMFGADPDIRANREATYASPDTAWSSAAHTRCWDCCEQIRNSARRRSRPARVSNDSR